MNKKQKLNFVRKNLKIYEKLKESDRAEDEEIVSSYEKYYEFVKEKIVKETDVYLRCVLYDFYIKGLTVERIAERIGYSVSQVKRLKKIGVNKIFK